MAPLKIEVRIERKHAATPCFAVIPAAKLARWKLGGATTVEGTLDGLALGRRSLLRWDDERWFVELRQEWLAKLGKGVGDRATLTLSLASVELPAELQRLIDSDAAARARWAAHTDAQQRMLREEILAAKTAATRERRARKALLPAAQPAPARVTGLAAQPRALSVRILGRRLPGRSCGAYSEIQVGFPLKGACDPASFFAGDAREARWETSVEVQEKNGVPAFRGPAVNGPPHERFLYLTWMGRKDGGAPAMFRRAKLRLDAVPAPVLAKALRSGTLVGRLELTARDGMPLCASVLPPAIQWADA